MQYKMWGIYSPLLEQWVREMGDKMEAYIDNDEVDLEIEYFSSDDPRVYHYNFTYLPAFVAVKHDQPWRQIFGKWTWDKYEEWLKGLNWKIDEV